MDTLSRTAKLSPEARVVLVRVKIERAKKHFVSLTRDLCTSQRSRRAILVKGDPKTGGTESREMRTVRELPFDAIAAAGDIIQNLRSALDHLANQLVLVAENEPTRRTCFPIADSFSTYEKEKGRKVNGMRPE